MCMKPRMVSYDIRRFHRLRRDIRETELRTALADSSITLEVKDSLVAGIRTFDN